LPHANLPFSLNEILVKIKEELNLPTLDQRSRIGWKHNLVHPQFW